MAKNIGKIMELQTKLGGLLIDSAKDPKLAKEIANIQKELCFLIFDTFKRKHSISMGELARLNLVTLNLVEHL